MNITKLKQTNFLLGLCFLGVSTMGSALTNTFEVNLDGSRYRLEQFDDNLTNRAFFVAWDCWVQNAKQVTLERSSTNVPTALILEVADYCKSQGTTQLRFELEEPESENKRTLHYVLTEPHFSHTALARDPNTRLAVALVRKHPHSDGITSLSSVPVLTLTIRIQYLKDGVPTHRGVSVNLNSVATWSVTKTELVSSELDERRCYPPIPSTCDNYIDTYERTWEHNLTGETVSTYYKVKRAKKD